MYLSSFDRSASDGDAHRPGSAFNLAFCSIEVVRVEVRKLRLRDRRELLIGDRSRAFAAWVLASLVKTNGLPQQHGGWWRLQDERERPVFVDRDLDGHDRSAHVLGRAVV